MKTSQKNLILLLALFISSFAYGNPVNNTNKTGSYSLTVKVDKLRNSKGMVQFSLYNKDGTIPDKKFTQYFKQLTGKISNNTSIVTFTQLPKGCYAVNILHDGNQDGKMIRALCYPLKV